MKSYLNTGRMLLMLCLLTPLLTIRAMGEDLAKVLSYNVLADPLEAELRLPTLFEILEKSDADIIGLQEVAPWFIAELEKQSWSKQYHSFRVEGQRVAPGGLLVLSKTPVTKLSADYLPTRQRRAFVIVETEIQGVKVRIANCHLESPLEAGEIRGRQLDLYFQKLQDSENAIFLGDFNFGDGEQPETGKLPANYVDSWLHTNGKDVGYTWNIEKSQMAEMGSFPNEKSRRLDRILIRSENFTPTKTEIIGDIAVTGQTGVFPSDHFGLLSTIRVKKEK